VRIRHHFSHRALLSRAGLSGSRSARLDAIIVPSARHADHVRHAAELAHAVNCPLIILASRQSRVDDVMPVVAQFEPDRLFVIDFASARPVPLPEMQTSKLLTTYGLGRPSDVSAKRNVGLAIARMTGMRRILFLDDDMLIPDATDLLSAAGLLDRYDAVGLRLAGFPDNSVVCHANRQTGGSQDMFVGGGALLVAADRIQSFFPDIYNEDWFLLLDQFKLRPVTETGRAIQRPYDPFASVDRAKAEEFGDVLAEGIFALLDEGRLIAEADAGYWESFIEQRRRLIEDTLHRARCGTIPDAGRRERMVRSLLAARDQLLTFVSPGRCVDFLDAWRQDLECWGTFLDDLERTRSIGAAIEALGVTYRTSANVTPLRPPSNLRSRWKSARSTSPRALGRRGAAGLVLLPSVAATVVFGLALLSLLSP
jgi:hypothetical protein